MRRERITLPEPIRNSHSAQEGSNAFGYDASLSRRISLLNLANRWQTRRITRRNI